MKVIIAGSRDITDIGYVIKAVGDACFGISEVVCGCARGVDKLGAKYAESLAIPVKEFKADWKGNGKSAGILRNCEMADYADALIAIWDGQSNGTAHMIKTAIDKRLKVFVRTAMKSEQDAVKELAGQGSV